MIATLAFYLLMVPVVAGLYDMTALATGG